MTEKQTWKKIGRAFLKEPEERSKKEDKIAGRGICSALMILGDYEYIFYSIRTKISCIIDSFLKDYYYSCFDDYRIRANQIARGDFCMLLSYMTDEEREELR